MSHRIQQGGLQVAEEIFDLVANELITDTGLTTGQFWASFEEIVNDLGPKNRALLKKRDDIQAQIDAWHGERKGQDHDAAAYKQFLTDIGYLLPEGDDFEIQVGGRLQPLASLDSRCNEGSERPVFPAYDLILQYEVMDAVGRHSDVPVPQLRGLETDKSLLGVQFYLMKHSAGRIPTDMPPYNMDGWMLHDASEGSASDEPGVEADASAQVTARTSSLRARSWSTARPCMPQPRTRMFMGCSLVSILTTRRRNRPRGSPTGLVRPE